MSIREIEGGVKIEAKEFLINEISKYNSSISKQQIEKVLDKYTDEQIERLADAMIRFGTDEIFKAILKKD